MSTEPQTSALAEPKRAQEAPVRYTLEAHACTDECRAGGLMVFSAKHSAAIAVNLYRPSFDESNDLFDDALVELVELANRAASLEALNAELAEGLEKTTDKLAAVLGVDCACNQFKTCEICDARDVLAKAKEAK